jgi:hypothetical protein
MISYKSKYEKYKLKYLELKKIIGGVPPKPKSTVFEKAKINMQCFTKKFIEKYGDKLSLISIINKYEPNYELWDEFIENTFSYIQSNIILTDEQIIKFLNNYFDIIKKHTDEVSSENPNIKILVDIIKCIVDEVLHFIDIHGEDEFYLFLATQTNFGKNSLEDKYLEIHKEKLPTVASGSDELYHEIDKIVKRFVPSSKMKEEKSILNFTIPLAKFTDEQKNTFKNSSISFSKKMPTDLQSALFLFQDKDVYKILEIVIFNGFKKLINDLQGGKGMGAHVIHFLRVKNNLALSTTSEEEKVKLSMPIYVHVMEVGLAKEFLSRIKHLIAYNFEALLRISNKKKGEFSLTEKQLTDENLRKKRNHIKVIMDLYKHIHNEDLWNFVRILYEINIRRNPELYNDIGLIISFLMVNYPLENSADKAQRIDLCQEDLVRYLNYKSKH